MISLIFCLYSSLVQKYDNVPNFSSKKNQDLMMKNKIYSFDHKSNNDLSKRTSQSKVFLKANVSNLQKYVKCPFYQLTNLFGTWEVSTTERLITTNEANAKVQFSFNGTSYIIVCSKDTNYGNIDIYLDRVKKETIHLASDSPDIAISQETELPFGEHTIEVIRTPDNTGPVNIKYICYDPTYNTERLSLVPSDIVTGDYSYHYNVKTTDGYSYLTPQSSSPTPVNFSFYGTRFWVTGSHKRDVGTITVKIDDQQVQNYESPDFNEYFTPDEVERGVLFYYSDILQPANHTVEISLSGDNVELCTLFYSQQPYNAVPLSSYDVELNNAWDRDSTKGAYTEGQYNTALFAMYGTHFWLIGDSDKNYPRFDVYNISLSGADQWELGIRAQSNGYVKNKLLQEYKMPLSSKRFLLKFIQESTSIKFHFLNCFYLNEEIMEPPRNRFITFKQLTNTNDWEEYKDADGQSQCLKSKTTNGINISFVGTRFWLEGSLDPSYGNISITLDGNQLSFPFFLYREKHVDQAIYYQSPELTYGQHTVMLKSANGKPVTFTRLYYEVTQPQNVLGDVDGLVRVNVKQMEQSPKQWTNSSGSDEMYSSSAGATASYTFDGTKVYITSKRNNANSLMEVYVDEKLVSIVDLNASSNQEERVYYSPDLPFGKHTIKVRHPGTHNGFISVCFIFYRPGLIYPEQCYNASDNPKTGWYKQTENGYTYLSTGGPDPYDYTFYGTRLWLTGNGNDVQFSVEIDDKSASPTATYYSNKFSSALLYDSGYLSLGTHNVKIKRLSNRAQLQIKNLIHIQQPKDATIIFPQDMTKSDGWLLSASDGFELYSVKDKDKQFETNFYGNQYWLFAKKAGGGGRFKINDNGTEFLTCNSASKINENCSTWIDGGRKLPLFLVDSRTLDSKYHNMKIIHADNYNDKYIQIHYLYYFHNISNQPTQNEEEILLSSFKYDSKWQLIEKDNKGVIFTRLFGATCSIIFGGSRFWLEGYLGPAGGLAFVYIDDNLDGNISLYREELGFSIFYESPILDNKYHTIQIESYSGDVSLSKLYYTPFPPTDGFSMSTYFTNSIAFSNSISFTSSTAFTKSSLFSESNDFSLSEEFTKSSDFSKSAFFSGSKVFSKSTFFSRSVTFTKSAIFTKSESFSGTSGFSHSEHFSESEFFTNTPTESFSKSLEFSKSFIFSESSEFTKSVSFTDIINEPKPGAENKTGSKSNTGVLVGVICAILVLLIVVLIIIIIVIKRRREQPSDEDSNAFELTGINMTQTLGNLSEDLGNSEVVDIFDDRFGNPE